MYKLLTKFKKKLNNNETVLGPFMKTGDPAFGEAAGYAGFDFLVLDTEHGPVNIENMQNNIRAALVSETLPIIRVKDSSENSIGKALDIGALGVQVPQVKSASQAEEIVRKTKFYSEGEKGKKGERGVCIFVRAAKYSALERKKYFKEANETLVILQLEGVEALENIDNIMGVKGVDILFIGPYDLSQSLGVPGEVSHPKVLENMEYIVNKAKEKDIVVGTFVDKPEGVKKWKDAGVQYISYLVDVGIFYEACKDIVKLR